MADPAADEAAAPGGQRVDEHRKVFPGGGSPHHGRGIASLHGDGDRFGDDQFLVVRVQSAAEAEQPLGADLAVASDGDVGVDVEPPVMRDLGLFQAEAGRFLPAAQDRFDHRLRIARQLDQHAVGVGADHQGVAAHLDALDQRHQAELAVQGDRQEGGRRIEPRMTLVLLAEERVNDQLVGVGLAFAAGRLASSRRDRMPPKIVR